MIYAKLHKKSFFMSLPFILAVASCTASGVTPRMTRADLGGGAPEKAPVGNLVPAGNGSQVSQARRDEAEADSRVTTAMEIAQAPVTAAQLKDAAAAVSHANQVVANASDALTQVVAAQSAASAAADKANAAAMAAAQAVTDTQAKLDAALAAATEAAQTGTDAAAASAAATIAAAKADTAAAQATKAKAEADNAAAQATLAQSQANTAAAQAALAQARADSAFAQASFAASAATSANTAATNAESTATTATSTSNVAAQKANFAISLANSALASSPYNVVNYGAKGDGIADDTAAIQATIDAARLATKGGNSGTLGTSGIYSGTAPIVFFPSGVYKVSQPITVPAYATIAGARSILVATTDLNDIISTSGYNVSISGMVFRRGANAISISTNNTDTCAINIVGCEFVEQQSAAAKVDASSQSTSLNIDGSKFYLTNSAAHILDLGSCDQAVIQNSWVTAGTDSAFNVSGGTLNLRNILGVPANTAGAWIRLAGGSVVADTCRFGGESGGKAILNCYTAASLSQPMSSTYAIIKDCQCYSSNKYAFAFYALPNLVSIQDNSGLETSYGIHFDPSIPTSQSKAIGNLIRIQIGGVQADLASADLNSDSFSTVQAGEANNRTITSLPGPDDRAASFTMDQDGFSKDASGTNVTSLLKTNSLGIPIDEFTATADNASYHHIFHAALGGLPAGTYTFVSDIEAVSSPVSIWYYYGDNQKTITLAPGKHIVSLPFNVDGTQKQDLGVALYRLRSGTTARIGTFRIFKGDVVLNTTNTEVNSNAPPSKGYWFEGDLVQNVTPMPGQPSSWICIANGTPGAWRPIGYLSNIRTVNSNAFSATSSDSIVEVSYPGAVTCTLPSLIEMAAFQGKEITVKDISGQADTNLISFQPGPGTTLESSAVINSPYGKLTWYLDGAVWRNK